MLAWLWLVPVLPLAGALLLLATAQRNSHRTTSAIGVGSVGLSLLVALAALAQFWATGRTPFTQTLFRWIAAGDLSIDWALRLDALSAVMVFFVTLVGFLIHVYSIGYMHGESA
ncbi:MAG: NADH-quinone oxidoreductase subunit L, partial [Thermoanaerobaculaceae bacterium]|nr:NADH-quinone oxidoreductase subunit L [Thermoanaerobaculaceae bacterium]